MFWGEDIMAVALVEASVEEEEEEEEEGERKMEVKKGMTQFRRAGARDPLDLGWWDEKGN